MEIRQALAGLTLALILGSGVAAADFNKGFKAYESWDFKTALAEFTPLAEQGHADAQYHLGLMHINGTGVLENHRTTVKWLSEAAKQGHAEAQHYLAIMCADGTGVFKDNVKA